MSYSIKVAREKVEDAFETNDNFATLRRALAVEEGIVLAEMEGFGGEQNWYGKTLLADLIRATSYSRIWQSSLIAMLPRLVEIEAKWEEEYDASGEREMFDLLYGVGGLCDWIRIAEQALASRESGEDFTVRFERV